MVDVVGARVYGTDACCPIWIRECSDRLPSSRACAVKARYVCGAHAIQTALWHKPHPSLTEICGQEQGGEISAHPADDTKVRPGFGGFGGQGKQGMVVPRPKRGECHRDTTWHSAP